MQWWADLSCHGDLSRTIWRSPDQAELHSDASLFAWGGVLNGKALAHGIWQQSERRHHITTLELLAVIRNVKAFLPRLKNKRVLLHEDNQAVVYIIRERTSRSPVIMAYMWKLWAILDLNQIDMQVQYVKSELNPADAPSRLNGANEWKLSPAVFQEFQQLYSQSTIDRFASSHNHLLPRYNCQFADPSAEAVNAMTQDWRGEDNWIHPPVDLLPDVALKLRLQPCQATVVAPYWPDKAWFRELRELSQKIEVRQSASQLVCRAFLRQWSLRGPGQWPLVFFRIEP